MDWCFPAVETHIALLAYGAVRYLTGNVRWSFHLNIHWNLPDWWVQLRVEGHLAILLGWLYSLVSLLNVGFYRVWVIFVMAKHGLSLFELFFILEGLRCCVQSIIQLKGHFMISNSIFSKIPLLISKFFFFKIELIAVRACVFPMTFCLESSSLRRKYSDY